MVITSDDTEQEDQVKSFSVLRQFPRMLLLGFLAGLLAACGGASRTILPLPEGLETQPLAGVLQRYDDTLWFRPCYERLWWPVEDYTGQTELLPQYERLSITGQGELYVEVKGAVDPQQNNRLLIDSLRVAGGNADTCAYRINNLQFRAASSSPNWVADLSEESAVVKTANPLGRYSFLVTRQQDELGTLYQETTQTERPFLIRITEQRCEDSNSGTLLAYHAQMHLFGHSYGGCARRGHQAEEQLEGYYWYADAEADQVVLNILPDRRAQLVRKNRQGRAVSERGSWQLLQSGKLILSMKRQDGKEFVLLLRQQENGELRLQNKDLSWASEQAAFVQWRPSGLPGGRLLPREGDQQNDAPTQSGDVISVPEFNPVPASPNGEQLIPITVTECAPETVDQSC